MTNGTGIDARKAVVRLIQDALASGQPSKLIREQLRTMGVRWTYSQGPQGAREKLRRQRQENLCITGCGRYADWKTNNTCFDCRAEAWQ